MCLTDERTKCGAESYAANERAVKRAVKRTESCAANEPAIERAVVPADAATHIGCGCLLFH